MSNLPHLDAITIVAKATIAGEQASDAALRNLADLVSATTTQAEAIQLPPHATQPTLDHLRTAMIAAFDSRRAVVMAHQELGALAQRLAAPVLTFDREKLRFTDNDAANALLDGPPVRQKRF